MVALTACVGIVNGAAGTLIIEVSTAPLPEADAAELPTTLVEITFA